MNKVFEMQMFRFFRAIVELGQDIMSTNANEPNALKRLLDEGFDQTYVWEQYVSDVEGIHICVKDGVMLQFRNSDLVNGICWADMYWMEKASLEEEWSSTYHTVPMMEPTDLSGINPELWNEQQDRIVEQLIERHNNANKLMDKQRVFAESTEEQIARFVDDMFGWMLHTTKGDWQ